MWLALATQLALAAPEGCEGSAPAGAFDDALASGEVAAGSLDAQGLNTAVQRATELLPCVAETLSTPDVARFYRLVGIERFVASDAAAVALWFGASRALEPAYTLDPALGSALADAWAAATPGTDRWDRPLPPPLAGWLQVDGRRSERAPSARPFLLQRFDGAGAVADNALVMPREPLPSWPVGEPAAPAAAEVRHPSRGLLIAGLVTGVAAGASAGGAAMVRANYVASDESAEALSGQLAANRALGWGSVGVGAVAVGLGAGAWIVGEW